MKKFFPPWIFLLAAALAAAFSSCQTSRPSTPPTFESPAHPVLLDGVLGGAPYRVRVPTNWNGTLLLYAHGYQKRARHPGETENRDPPDAPGPLESLVLPDMEPVLLARGFGLAGSAFRANGWDVREGIEDMLALREFFIQQVGRPKRTILWGLSLGAMIAARSIEETPRVYDGAICACMPGAGATRSWNKVLDLSLAYDAAVGWPKSWGTVRLVAPAVDYGKDVAPEIGRQLREKDWLARFEFVRASLGASPEDFYKVPAGSPALLTLMFFATEARAELQTRVGGPVGENLGRRYQPSAEVWTYLGSLGAKSEWLDWMNARSDMAPDEKARAYLARNADFSGRVQVPILSIHTTVDGLVSPAHESAYRDTLKSAGRDALLVQAFTNGVGHCLFSEAQLLDAVVAMESWLESGTPPGSDAFP
ncbi:MAG TPA: hypothetical protein VF376_03240, partial [Thermoanaerobaculia bacterium]